MIKFSQTLHMKTLWAIARGENSTWVRILTAKYMHRTDLWSCNRTSRCTPLHIIAVKPLLKEHVQWQIGDGQTIKALGQPWHEMWFHFSPNNAAQRKIKLAELVQLEDGGWNNQKLIELFGFGGALYLAITFPNGPTLTQRNDRLVFTYNRNGQFSIKGAYLMLTTNSAHPSPDDTSTRLYNLIWHSKNIIPRTRLFLWRAMKEALPVDEVLASRVGRLPGGCSICGDGPETTTHVLFKCPKARQVWISSQFGLRTDALPDRFEHLLAALVQCLDAQQFSTLAAILWHIWKDRCKEVFEGRKISAQHTLAAAHNLLHTIHAANYTFIKQPHIQEAPQPLTRFTCWLDASWVHTGQRGSGLAYALFDTGTLVQYRLKPTTSFSPFHAELSAFKMTITEVIALGVCDCCFFTDCAELHNLINGVTSFSEVEWRAYYDATDTVLFWNENTKRKFYCSHISRENNGLADGLAKLARTSNIDYVGFTFPCFPNVMNF
ncbi:RNA-directed DNA polymerase (reverse transcriptase)-related family protein [Rhynchospora pubera]|uniref:RNA-directed DNA polymerase (Reverse transcriptase)-related family protein n=1 Tax=Rhynchospora pubera TaxID=906938 RepID=A0AAV8HUF5_9POAL|nr:RNA-directed DNA polymerase (reverse transcriptase)-related family protein [Rhynchospora pubera]